MGEEEKLDSKPSLKEQTLKDACNDHQNVNRQKEIYKDEQKAGSPASSRNIARKDQVNFSSFKYDLQEMLPCVKSGKEDELIYAK